MRIQYSLLVALLASVLVIQVAPAEETKKEDGDSAVLRSSISKDSAKSCLGACHVNFRGELGVALDYLGSIGQQIHDARRSPDPVDLALAAQGLAVAEQVAGKKASITSAQIMAEAVEVAKLRGLSSELMALSHIVSDKAVSKDLTGMAKAAQAREEDERAATASGDMSKAIVGTLKVINHTHECLRIVVDGRFIGTVHEGHTRNFHVHAHRHHNHLSAYCEQGGELVQHRDYHGHAHYLTWHIDN